MSAAAKPDHWVRLQYEAGRFGQWMRHQFAAWTVATVTFAALWFAVGLACVTLYIWDASFYRSLAPPGMELTFQAAGVVFRTFVIFGGLFIVWAKTNKMPPAASGTIRFIWVFGLMACGVAALGFVTEGNDYHYRKNAAITTTETATTESADARLARIEAERAAVRADRDSLIAGARASMNLVLDDGNSRNDDVSAYEANIRQYETDAKAKLDALDARAAEIDRERLDARRAATSEAVDEPPLPAVFVTPQRYLPWFQPIMFRDVFAIFWVILLEACGSVGAQALLATQMAMAKRKRAQEAGAEGGKEAQRRRNRKLIEYAARAGQMQTRVNGSDPDGDEDGDSNSPPPRA